MTIVAAALARHDLLSVPASQWASVTTACGPLPDLSGAAEVMVTRWALAGRPVIVRRPQPADPRGAIPVGLPLPPSAGKLRVALAIPAHVEVQRVEAVTLATARRVAPTNWHPTIDRVLELGERLAVVPSVFGALLWQSLTGLPYLQPTSDLDVLWPIANCASTGALLDRLVHLDIDAPMRIDGEIVTGDGAVNWRELATARRGDAEVVLMKSLERTGFAKAAELLGREGARCS